MEAKLKADDKLMASVELAARQVIAALDDQNMWPKRNPRALADLSRRLRDRARESKDGGAFIVLMEFADAADAAAESGLPGG